MRQAVLLPLFRKLTSLKTCITQWNPKPDNSENLYHTLEPPKTDTSENLYHIVELRKLTPLKTYIIQRWQKSDTSENNYHSVEHSKTDNSEHLHHTTMIETWHLWKQLSYSETLENWQIWKPLSYSGTSKTDTSENLHHVMKPGKLTPLKTYITQWNRKLTPLKTYITQCNLENWHIWKHLLYYGTPEAWCLWQKPASLNTTRFSKDEWKCTKRKIILKVVWN